MKFLKAFLYCLLWFVLAFLVMFIIKNKESNNYEDIEVITMKVETWNLNNNKLPIFESFSLSFPWYSDDKIYNCSTNSNITVKASVLNPTIENGAISKLVFYYYNADDPNRILDFKETLINNPYTYFSIPRWWYEYKFWVKLYDNKGWAIDSEELLSGNPSLYLPPCYDDPDVPIVTLRLSATDIDVWDSVRYAVISRLSMESEDFEKNRKFYYDFTWDWVWDLITGSSIVEYTFTEWYPYLVRPRAGVEYRWEIWIWEGDKIYVSGYEPDDKTYNDIKGNNMSEYEVMKMEILMLISDNIKWDVIGLFSEFEESTSVEERAAILERISEVVTEDRESHKDDKHIIQNEFCSIVEYYDLSNYTQICEIS